VPSASVADAARSGLPFRSRKSPSFPMRWTLLISRWFPTRRPRGRRGGALEIGFIGRLDPIKRLPDLIEAVKLLEEQARLHIFGDGAERVRWSG